MTCPLYWIVFKFVDYDLAEAFVTDCVENSLEITDLSITHDLVLGVRMRDPDDLVARWGDWVVSMGVLTLRE